MSNTVSEWQTELELLLCALPPDLADATRSLLSSRSGLLEIVLDLGREPEARFDDGEVILSQQHVNLKDINYVTSRVGAFGDDNRAGIERTLHRISAIRNRRGIIIGLTCRVGRAVTGTIETIKDIVVSGQSILILGPPGIGKTTMLRECARVLADECSKRVVIVDTSNEIGGDGDIPHPGIGRARRMQVSTPLEQHAVMIEAVENHMPQVIVIDEIGTELEATAARTIAERGVQLVGTAHGTNLDNLLVNPTLNDLLGGIQTVTLSDEEAKRRGTQKSVLERKSPPTFDVLVELIQRDKIKLHMPLDKVVDEALRGQSFEPQPINSRAERKHDTVASPLERERNWAFRLVNGFTGDSHSNGNNKLAVFPYGISRNYIEQSMRELNLSLKIQNHIDSADVVLTLKNYYRRKDSPVRQAEAAGIPIHVLRSNTVAQIKGALSELVKHERR